MDESDLGFFSEVEDPLVTIELSINDPNDPGVGDQPEASPAGTRGDIHRATCDANPVSRCLSDRIGLGMNRPHTMAIFHEMTNVVTVRESPDGPVVASREDGLVSNDDGSNVSSVTGRPRGYDHGDLHEIFVPRRSFACHGRDIVHSHRGVVNGPLDVRE